MTEDKNNHIWTVILNPVSGNGLAKANLPKIEAMLQSKAFKYNIYYTEAAGLSIVKIKEIIESGCNHLIVLGGDGTLNEVANAIMLQTLYEPHQIKVGVIPIGTGNDWVKTAQIPNNIYEAINIIAAGNCKLQDVGCATYHDNGTIHKRFFINTAGSGLDSVVIEKANKKKGHNNKRKSNKLLYILTLLSAFWKYKPIDANIETDSGEKLSGKVLNFSIGIGRYNGGGMLPFPIAEPNDGYFEALFISNMPKIKMIFSFPKLFKGNLSTVKEVQYLHCKSLTLSASTPIFAETDGEVIGYTPITFDTIPSAFCYYCGKQ